MAAVSISTTEIDLSWTDTDSHNASYTIQVQRTDGGFSNIGTAGPAATSYAASGLAPNTNYTFWMIATAGGVDSVPSNTASAWTLPLPPSNPPLLTVTAGQTSGANFITLQWGDNDPNLTGFEIDRGDGSVVGSVATGVFTYTDNNVAGNTSYTYQVRAKNPGGVSAASNQASAVTYPSAVTGVSATARTATEVDLAWADSNGRGNAYTVRVDRKTGTGDYAPLTTLTGGAGAYADTGCSPNTRYTYRLTASNQTGDSPAAMSPEALTYPDVPTALQKTGATSTTLTFSWTETNAANAPITYHIQRREQYYQGYWTAYHALTTTSSATLTDTGLNANSTYAYEVMATNATGSSAYCGEMQFTTGPAAPQYLYAYVMSSTAIQLYWNDPTGGTGTFTLWRQTGSGAPVDAGDYPAGKTNTTDTGLTPFTTYTYTVIAHNINGDSDPSPPCNATTKPAPPGGVTATAISSSEIDLSWNDTSGGRASFIILRGYGTNFTQVGTAVVGVNTYQDTNLTPNVTYSYEIEAVNGSGNSDPSAPASATTWPGAPTGLTATAVSSTEIDLTWDAANSEYGSTLQYLIERKSGDADFSQVTLATGAGYQDKTPPLTPDTQYTYRLTAVNGDGNYSPATAPVSATTFPGAPTNLTAKAGPGIVVLAWAASPGASAYNVKRSTTSGGPYTTISAAGGVSDVTFSDAAVNNGTTYYYVVTALPPAGSGYPVESPNSNEASATPFAANMLIQVARVGVTTFGSTARVAAGAVETDAHRAIVQVTVTGSDGSPIAGIPVLKPTISGGGGCDPGKDAVLTPSQGVTDASGNIQWTYRSSDRMMHHDGDGNPLSSVTIQVSQGGYGGGGSPGSGQQITIDQRYDDAVDITDDVDATNWTVPGSVTFELKQPVTFKPAFKDGSRVPITGHGITFGAAALNLWEWDESNLTYNFVPGVDPTLFPGLVEFDNVDPVGVPNGVYSSNVLVHWDPDLIVDNLQYIANDSNVGGGW